MKNFDEVFELMKTSFPPNEHRGYQKQKELLSHNLYKIITMQNEQGVTTAFMCIWDLPDFYFIEHLAVSPLCRGMGLGSKIVKNFLESSEKPVVLEIEIPSDTISIKRLRFYEKLGFVLNTYRYFQPPLKKDDSPLPLNLMSYPEKIDSDDFKAIKNEIYENIYNEKSY